MSKKTSPGRRRPASRDRRKHADVPFPQVREMVDDLHAVCDAVESGIPLERVATVRTHRIRREAPRLSPDEIRAIRDSLGLSQARFAEFLDSRTGHRALWELGQREQSALARRLLVAIRDDPAYWRRRLAKMAKPRPPRSRRRNG